MTRSTQVLRFAIAAVAAGVAPLTSLDLAAQEPGVIADSRAQQSDLYTVEELDNLLAPVALYPDPILAQLFVAATYPDQIALAARYVEEYGTDGIDDQPWDVSVRSIARYAPVLNMLAERPNWATAVGRAYAMQSGDVMASVQSLRRMARAQGNLVSTDQQRVEVEREYIRIVPAQPRLVYVPVYDPYVVYYRPVNYVHVHTPYWSFGVGYPIGVWLNYDLDWGTRVVYYHGWGRYGHRYRHTWYHVSSPFISFNSFYFGPRYTVISINRTVIHRHVNYRGFDRYNTVHRNTGWNRPYLPGRGYAARPGSNGPRPDRYGIPANGGAVGRADKPRGNVVPRVGGSSSSGTVSNGRPSRGEGDGAPGRGPGNGNNGNSGRGAGNGRGNGGSGSNDVVARSDAGGERVKPVRIGGNSRPLYPRGEDISADRIRGNGTSTDGARREAASPRAGSSVSNGTWNPRGSERGSDRVSAPVTRGRDADPVRAPRASSERIAPATSNRSERSQPRYDSPRNDAPRYDAPRSQAPRYESPRYEAPRSQPRVERAPSGGSRGGSAPRVSAPRSSEPRMSAPRGGGSAPRASAPRSNGNGGSAPRASRGGGRDRG